MSNSSGSSKHSTNPEISTIDVTSEQAQGLGVTVERRSVGTFRASDLVPQRAGILATAHMPNGEPAFSLTPETLIMVGKVPVPLHRAEALGIVKRDGQGNYIDASAEAQQHSQAEQQREAEQQEKDSQFSVAISEEGRAFIGDLHDALQAIGASPREAALEFLKDPAAASRKYGPALSKLTGSSEDEIGQDLIETRQELIGQVVALANEEGIDPREFGAFLSRNRHAAHAAILEVLDGNASSMRRLITRFKADKPNYRRPTPPGLKTRKTADGTEYVSVKLPNGRVIEVSVANARMQGWIK